MSGAGVGVGGFGARDEGVKFHEGIGAEGRRVDLLGWICGAEFGGEVGEVGECQLAGVGAFTDADVDNVGRYEVAVRRSQYVMKGWKNEDHNPEGIVM